MKSCFNSNRIKYAPELPDETSEPFNYEGAKKAVAIKIVEENPDLFWDDALIMADDFLKQGSRVIIFAEVNGKDYHFIGPNKFRFPGLCEDCF